MFTDKIPITSEKRLTYNGVFDIREVYNYLKSYLEDSLHYDLTEKEFVETNQGSKRKIDCHVEADLQYNDYFKVTIKYRVESSGKETTIMHKGKELKLTEGTISLRINSYIEADWQNKRGKSSFAKFLDQLYNKYIGRDEIETCIGKSAADVGAFANEFKKVTNTYLQK